jgi:ABC-2 type transport system ATP-binding protein
MIEVKGLKKSFDGFMALNGLDMHVDTGSIYGLIGVNGSGKTTLIKHLTGVLKPDAGEILFDGQPVFDNIAVKEKTGYIPDDLYFFNAYTLKNMAAYYRRLYPNWNEETYRAILADFGLSESGKIGKFSKGMQKQAALLLVLSTKPDVLILDEPVDGLDPIMRKKLWKYVLSDVAERNMTVLISSHNLRELEGICDAVGILNAGRILFEGKLDDLKDNVKDMSLEELFMYEMGGENDEK